MLLESEYFLGFFELWAKYDTLGRLVWKTPFLTCLDQNTDQIKKCK